MSSLRERLRPNCGAGIGKSKPLSSKPPKRDDEEEDDNKKKHKKVKDLLSKPTKAQLRKIQNLRRIPFIPLGATDAITEEKIETYDHMMDFNNEHEYGRYYKIDTFERLEEDNRNPFTNEPIDDDTLIEYDALLRKKLRGEGQLRGGSIPKAMMQEMAQSAYSGKTKLSVGPFKLFFSTPTLKFYKDDNAKLIVVSIRGTQLSDKNDLYADLLAFQGKLRTSERYQKDKQTIEKVQQQYPKTEYRYIGVGHSLGGAILDLFLRDGYILNGMSYNPLVEPRELGGNPKHYRIYHKDDPLYKLFGNMIPNVEVRTTAEPFWKYGLKYTLPEPLGDLFQLYDRHKLKIFKGGAIQSAFQTQLMELGIDPKHYLDMARKNADGKGYDVSTIDFSDDKTHKLRIERPDGKIVRFGRVGYNDFLIWYHLEANNQVPNGTAKAKQDRYWKSHTKLKGNWKQNEYSPNWLSLNILW
jgi:hypothetical protein